MQGKNQGSRRGERHPGQNITPKDRQEYLYKALQGTCLKKVIRWPH